MATVFQLLDMNNSELEWVTEYLGHTADIHKTWYRQEASTIELTKVAKLLIEKVKNVNFKNKKMKDITGNQCFLTKSNARFSQVWRVRGKLDVFWMVREYYGKSVQIQ